MRKFFLLLCLLPAACGSVNPFTVARLAAMSPLEADPAGFAVTVELPPGLRLRPYGHHLELAARRADTGAEIAGRFPLVAEREEGREVWRIDPERLDALRATQATARMWEAEAPDATEGHLSVAVAACADGAGPDPDARFSVFLRTESGGPLRPMIDNAGVRDAFGPSGRDGIPDCGDMPPR